MSLKYNWNLSIDLNGNDKSSPNTYFRFSNLNRKLKKEIWQCSQNLDLNQTYVTCTSE